MNHYYSVIFSSLCYTQTKFLSQNRRSSLNLQADFLKRAETKGCDHVIVIRPTQDPYPLKIQRLTRPPTIFLVHKLIINGKMQMRFDTPTSSIIQNGDGGREPHISIHLNGSWGNSWHSAVGFSWKLKKKTRQITIVYFLRKAYLFTSHWGWICPKLNWNSYPCVLSQIFFLRLLMRNG